MAATLPDSATERLATDQKATVSLTVGFLVNGTPVSKTARLHGPGDIAGIDPLQIVRVEPRPATPDFEPNYFPLIEFDRPDFPWLFSPLKADGQGRLRPWLCPSRSANSLVWCCARRPRNHCRCSRSPRRRVRATSCPTSRSRICGRMRRSPGPAALN